MTDPRARALLELLLIAGLIRLLHSGLHALGAPIASTALATAAVLALCTWLLYRSGSTWDALGLRRPTRLSRIIAWVAGLFLVEMLVPPMVATPIANALQLPQQHLEVFAGLQGNTTRYLVMLVPVAWGAAALGEELIYRGFLFSRLTQLFAGRCYGTGLALIGQAALFSMGHTYLGPRGMLNAGILGLIAGAAYVANGRNLWPLIVAHGLVDTVGITVLYLGIAHG